MGKRRAAHTSSAVGDAATTVAHATGGAATIPPSHTTSSAATSVAHAIGGAATRFPLSSSLGV